jgi:hypothetical protein
MDTINPNQRRVWGPPVPGWENNGVVAVGSSVLADRAKQRAILFVISAICYSAHLAQLGRSYLRHFFNQRNLKACQ